jgi:hypothetical protein
MTNSCAFFWSTGYKELNVSILIRIDLGRPQRDAVFFHFLVKQGAVFADLGLRLGAEKPAIRFVEVRDVTVGIRHHVVVVYTVKDQFKNCQSLFQCCRFGRMAGLVFHSVV